jgi:two-component system OmpR family sensor kinase
VTRVRRPGDVSLTVRLIAAVLLVTGLALALTGVGATTALRGYLQSRIDNQLTSYADGPGAHTDPRNTGRGGGPDDLNAFYVAHLSTRGVVDGEAISTTDSPPALPTVTAAMVAARAGRPFTVPAADGGGSWRVVLLSAEDGTGWTAVAVSARGVDATVARLVVLEVGVGAAVLVLIALVAGWLVRRSLRPLAAVEATASRIAEGDLSLRVPAPATRDEVGRLSLALNAMLAQIETAFRARQVSEEQARASEEQARASEEQARPSEVRKRRFVADASHELRTPLTSIRGYAELYRQGAVPPGDQLDRVLGRVEDEARRMGVLVEELLTLARLDQQRPLERAEVDLLSLAADAVHDATAVDSRRTYRLQAGSEGLPVVLGDDARLRQVIANLLSNAQAHTPAGTNVDVHVRVDGPDVVLDVADDGPGMREHHASRVFERFYRADEARTRSTGGSGLGLSIVAAIVATHGGHVDVDSAPGCGTRFTVVLPLADSRRTTLAGV